MCYKMQYKTDLISMNGIPYPIGCKMYSDYDKTKGYYYFNSNEGYEYKYVELDSSIQTKNIYVIYGNTIQWTVIQFAAAVGNSKSVDFFVKKNADVSIKDKTGRTAQDIIHFMNHSNVNIGKSMKKTTNLILDEKINEKKKKIGNLKNSNNKLQERIKLLKEQRKTRKKFFEN